MTNAFPTSLAAASQVNGAGANSASSEANGLPGVPASTPPWPTREELAPDWAWAYETGEKCGYNDYLNKHVAILNKTIVGSGSDHVRLRQEMASKFAVHPERIVIIYIDSPYVDVEE